MIAQIIQVLIIVLGPLGAIWLVKRIRLDSWLSPVVLAYGLGIIMANALSNISTTISTTFSELTVLLAIPMLLFSTDIKGWLQYAPKTLISFGLCVLSGLVASGLVAFFFQGNGLDNWIISGMLVGVYTGGTPNMQAIGVALGAGEEMYVLLNAADIFCGGIYLLFLTSIAHRVFGFFLLDFKGDKGVLKDSAPTGESKVLAKDVLRGIGLTLFIIALSLGLVQLFTGAITSGSWIILLLTSFSVLASFSPKIRAWQGLFETGEYLLLMFCVAVGMLFDFNVLWNDGGEIIFYTGCVLLITASLHLLLSILFKIDRDTTLITATAALYGPVFIGQVATSIGNRTLVFSGMATGLIGFALGNYLGIGLGYLLKAWF